MLIDSHCHLYVQEFEEDLPLVMQRAMDAGVQKFYLPAIDSSTTRAMLKLEAAYPGVCICMAGLHPCSVKDDFEAALNLVKQQLNERKFAAIGEIGLDFYWDKTHLQQQYDAFHMQIELAIANQLPVVIHTRDAMKETLEVVSNYKGKIKGIFHCFGGTIEEANQVIELGFLMGIGGVVTYKNAGLAETIRHIDLKHIVLETDAPYLTPVPFRGKRNESSYLKYIQEKIAQAKNTSLEEVEAATTANALNLFAL
ncbi:TatD family hydrolase [soil metagenome]